MKQFVLAILWTSALAAQPACANESDDTNTLTEAQIQQVEAALELAPSDSHIKFSWQKDITRVEGSVIRRAEAQAYASRLMKAGIFGERLLHLSTEENGAFRIEIGEASDSEK